MMGVSWLPVDREQAGMSWNKDRTTEGSIAVMNKRDWKSMGEADTFRPGKC